MSEVILYIPCFGQSESWLKVASSTVSLKVLPLKQQVVGPISKELLFKLDGETM